MVSLLRGVWCIAAGRHRFRDVIDFSPLAAAIIDSYGRYTYINRAFTDLFGYTLEDIPTGKNWFRLAFPNDPQRREAIAAWKTDREQAGPARGRFRSGAGTGR